MEGDEWKERMEGDGWKERMEGDGWKEMNGRRERVGENGRR